MTGCPECSESRFVISCAERGGWLIKCQYGHEVFPFPGMTLVVHDGEITPTQITYRSR